ncbi:MAG: radical SAM protein [Candidatus Thiodiazotropha sp.]
MSEKLDALFIGYESQENLGLRYIMAYLARKNFSSRLIPFNPNAPDTVVDIALRTEPKLIGLSIIFQYTIADFKKVLIMLRSAGINCHLTAGGHFPTLRPIDTFVELPQLDSIVRFEGEITTAELLVRLENDRDWRDIAGLALRNGSEITANPPHPLIANLDELPWPIRSAPTVMRGIPTASMLASRGCCFDCAFCSIRQFYGSAPGSLRRVRSPEDVVAEMCHLNESEGIRLFVFHDDDFAAKTARQRRWMDLFLQNLHKTGLYRRVAWKISCRADDVDASILERAKAHGLSSVYIGVESGHPEGLATLNKHTTVEQNLIALRTLKNIGLAYDMGFMLIDPSSSLESIHKNVHFLRLVAEIGGLPISFAKTMPLAGTPLEQQLRETKRLTGTMIRPDYDLLDPRADHLALFITLHFSFRNSNPKGLVERLRAAAFDHTLARSFESGDWIDAYGESLNALIDRSNAAALDALELLIDIVKDLPPAADSVPGIWTELTRIMEAEHAEEWALNAQLKELLINYSPNLAAVFADEDESGREDNYVFCSSRHYSEAEHSMQSAPSS